MTTIFTNFKSIIGRMIILLIFLIAICLVGYYGIIMNETKNGIVLLYLLILLLICFSFNICISFFGIIKVEVNKSLGQITFIRFFSKKTILISDITAYYKSVYNTKHGTSYGRIIKTSDNRIRELNPGNLKELNTMDELLDSPSIDFLGEKKSLYPFTSGL